MLIHGGVTSAKGFTAWGDHVGFKKRRKDLALIVSEIPANFAATLTTNMTKAAPIKWNQQILDSGEKVKAILVNSGQANSCTGAQGLLNAAVMAEKTAEILQCKPGEIVLASTGLIGPQIPMQQALEGIPKVAKNLRSDAFAGSAAAEAILTTDACTKQCATTFNVSGKQIVVGAMAKGSGMIHPNMATMLSFITTDLNITPALLQKALKQSVAKTYNMISVDGDTSTNDMVTALANGMAGNDEIVEEDHEGYRLFCQALDHVNHYLAKKIASDADGATKKLTVSLTGSACEQDARALARSVVSSNLVKAAMFEAEPNWGRVVVALGSAGVQFDPSAMCIGFASVVGEMTAVEAGEQHPSYSAALAKHILGADEIEIIIDLNGGTHRATAWGCDMRHDSIRKTSPLSAVPTDDATTTPSLESYAEVC